MIHFEINNYVDESTTYELKFIFFCESCGKKIFEYSYPNRDGYKIRLFSNQHSKEKEWIKNHDFALQTAKELALEKMNRCEVCGKLICDECAVEAANLNGSICCKKCNNKKIRR